MVNPLLPANQEEPISLVVIGSGLYSEIGVVGQIHMARDDDAAIAACKRKKVSVLQLPYFKIFSADQVVMISRKVPWQRGADFTAESDHGGVWNEFYTNNQGRFMRVSDAYQYVVYQLQLAVMKDIPADFPDKNPDLDIGWMVYRSNEMP